MTIQIDVTYRARPGHGLSNKDAVVVGPALHDLVETTGRLDPPTIVRAAKPEGSALHRYFDWDDRVAGPRWRLHQARQLVRSIEITLHEDAEPLPAFYSVAMTDDEQDREYLPVGDVLSNVALIAKTTARFRRDISRLKDEYDLFRRVASFERKAGRVLEAVEEAIAAEELA